MPRLLLRTPEFLGKMRGGASHKRNLTQRLVEVGNQIVFAFQSNGNPQ
jgi:hypothetical protein